ncbi:L-threonylcarbamoyladenylate synthase [Candidatus Saccharibacteria bacterium]|nr:L-threonylcarbamoyladenylate synthase [Candidatus Saccharibacteria bacterium]
MSTAPILTSQNDAIGFLNKPGGIGVLRTDTLYGVVAKASDNLAVERVYTVKGRTPTKSPIILISSLGQLYDYYDADTIAYLSSVWPAAVSVILPSVNAPQWLQRGNMSVAYRLPNSPLLCQLIDKTGPLIAPSANPEGLTPAHSINEAHTYFGDLVDFYIDGGEVPLNTPPSQLIRYDTLAHKTERLR